MTDTQLRTFDREFFGLAKTWLACRFRIMNGDRIVGCKIPFDLTFDILGETDSMGEMRMLCKEVKGGLYRVSGV